MAFVPEDGSGMTNSNSYVSVEYADAYFADRGITDWVGTQPLKEAWLIRATDYIDMIFGQQFLGIVSNPSQALSWPRKVACNAPAFVPEEVKKACCEYALRAKLGPLAPDPEISANGQLVEIKEEKVGPILEKTSYSAAAGPSALIIIKPYPAADRLLTRWLYPSGRVIR